MSPFVATSTVFLALLVGASAYSNPSEGKEIVKKVMAAVRETLPNNSFEVHGFKVDWYNELVEPKFQLKYDKDTVALSILTIPGVFENTFTPFLCEKGLSVANNSWHNFIEFYIDKLQAKLKKDLALDIPEKDILHSCKIPTPGQPMISVQAAAYAAGAVYYYQRKDFPDVTWPKNKTIYGVSLHPIHGGWILMGPVIVLEGVKYADMPRKQPKDVLVTEAKKIDLLAKANFEYHTQEWRDAINVKKKYSEARQNYSKTYGNERTAWVKKYYKNKCDGEGKSV